MDGIFHVVRAFDSDEVVHVDDSVDPIRDLETIVSELCLKDLGMLDAAEQKETEAVRKEKGLGKKAEVPLSDAFKETMSKVRTLLESNTAVSCGTFSNTEIDIVKEKVSA